MKAIEIAMSMEVAAESTMRTLHREAEMVQWAAEQLRQGATLPPAIQLRLLDGRSESCLALKADHFMFATMAAELAREVLTLQGEVRRLEERLAVQPPASPPPLPAPLPWWRRFFRARGS